MALPIHSIPPLRISHCGEAPQRRQKRHTEDPTVRDRQEEYLRDPFVGTEFGLDLGGVGGGEDGLVVKQWQTRIGDCFCGVQYKGFDLHCETGKGTGPEGDRRNRGVAA
jgi:hypothetical protein